MRRISIAGRTLGPGCKPYIIAELSGNHNQSLDRALMLIDAASAASVDAVKLQTYTADTMTIDVSEGEFTIRSKSSPWYGKTLYQLYQEAHTPWEWHEPILRRCREKGLTCFSTPFDESAVEFLEDLGVPCYKIASFENTDHALIEKVARTGKPLFLSTGMASLDELEEAVALVRSVGNEQLILLKCTSAYPAPPEAANISTIPDLYQRFRCYVGLSDHTLGVNVATGSVALGAIAIEKHLTLKRSDGGVDAGFSLEPEEMAALVSASATVWASLGTPTYGPTKQERDSLVFRRSLYIVRDIETGAVLTRDNLRAIRPGFGLPPKLLTTFLGKRVVKDVKRGTPLSLDLIEKE